MEEQARMIQNLDAWKIEEFETRDLFIDFFLKNCLSKVQKIALKHGHLGYAPCCFILEESDDSYIIHILNLGDLSHPHVWPLAIKATNDRMGGFGFAVLHEAMGITPSNGNAESMIAILFNLTEDRQFKDSRGYFAHMTQESGKFSFGDIMEAPRGRTGVMWGTQVLGTDDQWN